MLKLTLPLLLLIALTGCIRVKMDPVKIDATVTVRLERELDDFFNDIDSASTTTSVPDEPANP